MMANASEQITAQVIEYCNDQLNSFKETMGYKGWIYCHSSYILDDGKEFNIGFICQNNSLRPVMNTNNWRPATKEELKQYFEKKFNINLTCNQTQST